MDENLPFEQQKREIKIKIQCKPDSVYGCSPEKRSIDLLLKSGVINVNKPAGPTSHQVSDYVKKILKVNKAGHAGTLDPNVTGVLPVAVGSATRIVQALITSGKEYVALMHMHKEVSENKIKETVNGFLGKIRQTPPVRSAVKRQERTREVYYLNLMEISGKDVLFKVGCQAGTYIRKLIWDMGKALGTGAHMVQLVRTKAGPFTDKTWHSLQELKDAVEFYREGDEKGIRKVILPIESAVVHLPKVWAHDSAVANLCHGANLGVQGIVKVETAIKHKDTVALMTVKDELIGLGEATMTTEQMLNEQKGPGVTIRKIFMERDIYPREKKNDAH